MRDKININLGLIRIPPVVRSILTGREDLKWNVPFVQGFKRWISMARNCKKDTPFRGASGKGTEAQRWESAGLILVKYKLYAMCMLCFPGRRGRLTSI